MITIVVGAQYGGEGKGKVAAFLALKDRPQIVCRCGGPNSSHTVIHNGATIRLRSMPTAAVINPKITVVFGAGTLIHVPTLMEEIQLLNYRGRLLIDRKAGIITDEIVALQREDSRYESIGSTLTGTGLATAYRSQRKLPLASEFSELSKYMFDTFSYLNSEIKKKSNILVEGHQGYGLSNYHGDYPYTSSRDSTASEMLSELGLGPLVPGLRIVLVAKVFPTRNHAGTVGEELSEKTADALGIAEFGGGSRGIPNRRRRVGMIDFDFVGRAAAANSATEVVLTGIDYLDREMHNKVEFEDFSEKVKLFILATAKATHCPVTYISTGAETMAMIELPARDRKTVKKLSRARDSKTVKEILPLLDWKDDKHA